MSTPYIIEVILLKNAAKGRRFEKRGSRRGWWGWGVGGGGGGGCGGGHIGRCLYRGRFKPFVH